MDQSSKNNNPFEQPRDFKSIQKTDPANNTTDNPNAIQHQQIADNDKLKSSGKQIDKVNAPIVSINPTSSDSSSNKKQDFKIIDNPNMDINKQKPSDDYKYPFDKMKLGQGVFVPVEPNSTTDKLMDEIHDKIYNYREQHSECEKDKNGDDVWESVVIQTKKRTTDGIIQLDGAGKPIVGANQTNRPKLIYSANFIARPVVKGDEYADGQKADGDGALIIRVL